MTKFTSRIHGYFRRTKSIKIRVSEDELAQLQAKKGRAELARWIRELALSENANHHHVIKHQLPPEVVRILAGIGANLNQLARHLNVTAKSQNVSQLVDRLELIGQLQATQKALEAVREYLSRDS